MSIFIDPLFEKYYGQFPLTLIDVGASGGFPDLWKKAYKHLQVVGFEPDDREFAQLISSQTKEEAQKIRYLNTALYKEKTLIEFHLARKQQVSSMFLPNRDFLDSFPESERFDVLKSVNLKADTLDKQLGEHRIKDADFIKLDTQGSELSILEGATETLNNLVFGLEVEVEFAPIYKDAPLFSEVDNFVRKLGFQLFDLKSYWWKRKTGKSYGGPKGQIIFADALYLKDFDGFLCKISSQKENGPFRKSKVLKAISICILYGYLDYAVRIVEQAKDTGILTNGEVQLFNNYMRQHVAFLKMPNFPGKGKLASLSYVLSKFFKQSYHGWATADRCLGNLE